jgi:DNA-binding helix-hairpin-helix protein with protein kinase domain
VSTVQIFDARGDDVPLGAKLNEGDEGAVFDLPGRPNFVAKIYHKPKGRPHAAKLSAMATMAEDRLFRIAAWPSETLYDLSRTVVGFIMPKITGHRPVFQLYGPKLRLQEFPQADWRFLIHAAANAVRAFATVHAAGQIIGDVNHGSRLSR